MKITIKNIMIDGTRTVFHNFKFVILHWGLNVCAAFILSIPIYTYLIDNLSHSFTSDSLGLGFDFFWYVQFRKLYEIHLKVLPVSIYGMVAIYAMVQTFFLGGLVAVFHIPKKNHMVDFFYGGVKFWLRFIKVTIISLLFFAIAFVINDLLGFAIIYIFQSTEHVLAEFIFSSIRYLLLIFLIGVVTIISDYSKVSLAIEDKTKIFRAVYDAIIFIKKNFQLVFIVFLLIAITGAAGVVVYNLIGRQIPRTPYYFLILSFILQQMLIIFRLLIRMFFTATEVSLYKDLNAEIVRANP
ncbi:MAG: hypothetical protein PVH88_12530 [Ignavibacteria bacterium]|jgi:hypothetical protein